MYDTFSQYDNITIQQFSDNLYIASHVSASLTEKKMAVPTYS